MCSVVLFVQVGECLVRIRQRVNKLMVTHAFGHVTNILVGDFERCSRCKVRGIGAALPLHDACMD